MHFWRIDRLKDELRQGALPQRQQFYYYLAQSVILSVVMIPVAEPNSYDVISGVVAVFIAVFGTVYLYRCNAGDHGLRFLERVVSIGFVVTIRLIVLLMLPVLVTYSIMAAWQAEIPAETTLNEVVIFTLVEIFYFWRIGVHVKQVAHGGVA